MRVCYFGTYESNYPRNQILIKGLERNGVEVIQCHTPLWEISQDKTTGFSNILSKFKLLFRILYAYLQLIYTYFRINNYDVMIVGYPGHFDMFLAKILAVMKKKPVVFDAFLSLYDSMVCDRKVVKQGSIKAKLLHFVDKSACVLADLVLLDTNEHINYFCEEFRIKKDKFRRIFIGADDNNFAPIEKSNKDKNFLIVHYGKFIPLHGLKYIIEAAKILETHEEIKFELIGEGQLFREMYTLSKRLCIFNNI